MPLPEPRVAIIGAGFAGLNTAIHLARDPEFRGHISLFNSGDGLYNYPILPSTLYHPRARAHLSLPIPRLLDRLGIEFIPRRVQGLDARTLSLRLDEGEARRFDALALATGAKACPLPQDDGLWVHYPKSSRHLSQLHDMISGHDRSEQQRAHRRISVVGAGLSGIEFVFALQALIRSHQRPGATPWQCELFEQAERVAPECPPAFSALLLQQLHLAGIRVHLGQRVSHIAQAGIRCDGRLWPRDVVVNCSGNRANINFDLDGLAQGREGLLVDQYLRAQDHQRLFILGDVIEPTAAAHRNINLHRARHALHQGQLVAANIRRSLHDQALVPYRPKTQITLVSTGPESAALSLGPLRLSGTWLAHLKHYLDRRLLARFGPTSRPGA